MSEQETPESLIWLVGVDFSMLLLGIAMVVCAIRFQVGFQSSNVDDLAQVFVSTNIDDCFEVKWAVETNGPGRIVVQEPREAAPLKTGLPHVLVVQGTKETSLTGRIHIQTKRGCSSKSADLDRIQTHIGEMLNGHNIWPSECNFEDLQTLEEDYRKAVQGSWPIKKLAISRQKLINNHNKFREGIKAAPQLKFFSKHYFDRVSVLTKGSGIAFEPISLAPEGRSSEYLTVRQLLADDIRRKLEGVALKSSESLAKRYASLLDNTTESRSDLTLLLIGIELDVILEVPTLVRIRIEARAPGDCFGKNLEADPCEAVEERTILFKKLRSPTQPDGYIDIYELSFHKKKETEIKWKLRDNSDGN